MTAINQSVSRRLFIQGAASLAGAGVLGIGLKKGVFAHTGHDATPAAVDYPEAVYTTKEYAIEGPTALQSGFQTITLKNTGAMDHHIMFMKLNEGKTLADLAAAKDLPSLLAAVVSYGGPGSIGGGQSVSVILDLAVGDYVLACLIPDADGVPHMAKGMVLPLTVTQAIGEALPAPKEDLAVDLTEFSFHNFPKTVATGQQLWKVQNIGAQLHELAIFKLADGVTADQVLELIGAPADSMPGMDMGTPDHSMAGMEMGTPAPAAAPFVMVSGVAPIFPKEVNWLKVDFAPGNYLAVCYVPDPESGAPHFALGMAMPFSVS
jgi:hypothetical protein